MAINWISAAFAANSNIAATKGCPASGIYNTGLLKGIPCDRPLSDINAVVTLVENLVLGYILPLVGTLFIIMIIFGGILYITSAGNEQRAKKGKDALTAAIIGLLITTLAYTIIVIFTKFIGGGIG